MIVKRMYYAMVRALTRRFSDQKITSLLCQYREAQDRYAGRITIFASPVFSGMLPDAEARMDESQEDCVHLREACKQAGARKVQLRAFGFIYYGSGGVTDMFLGNF